MTTKTVPVEPTEEDRKGGWLIATSYLIDIKQRISDDYPSVDWEEIEAILLAAAPPAEPNAAQQEGQSLDASSTNTEGRAEPAASAPTYHLSWAEQRIMRNALIRSSKPADTAPMTAVEIEHIMSLVDDYADSLLTAVRADGGINFAEGFVAKVKKDAIREALRRVK